MRSMSTEPRPPRSRRLRGWLIALVVVLVATGCVRSDLTVSVNDDGSGTYSAIVAFNPKAFADLAPPPDTSALNYTAGQTVANLAFVRVNAWNQRLTMFASDGCPHMVIDVVGYYR